MHTQLRIPVSILTTLLTLSITDKRGRPAWHVRNTGFLCVQASSLQGKEGSKTQQRAADGGPASRTPSAQRCPPPNAPAQAPSPGLLLPRLAVAGRTGGRVGASRRGDRLPDPRRSLWIWRTSCTHGARSLQSTRHTAVGPRVPDACVLWTSTPVSLARVYSSPISGQRMVWVLPCCALPGSKRLIED